ncbi:MAG: lytic transglycosylase domain-containing protein [Alphaproteobacteria bacterium]|nr:lytic transglycosylase domain-containing protein [Alphaproteobacteria bacterium]
MSSTPRTLAALLALSVSVGIGAGTGMGTEARAAQALASPIIMPRPAIDADIDGTIKVSDILIYKEIFALQDNANWGRADRLIRKLDSTDLLGHVLFQRYIHPTAYRTRWTELRDWLKNYADQPGAWQIYKLALKRKPSSIALPKQPPERIYHNARASAPATLFTTRTKRRIKNHIYDLVQRERPTQALRYINRRSNRNRLSRNESNFLKSLIARSYYIERKVKQSLELAEHASESRRVAPLADWHAGLAAYRLEQMPRALKHFQNLTYNPVASATLRARGAFWAGRSLRNMGRVAEAEDYFRQAASSGAHFYALLATQHITPDFKVKWDNHSAPIDDLFLTHPALRRAELLRAADQENRAEAELLYLQERASEGEARALLTYLETHDYPAVQMTVSQRLNPPIRQNTQAGAQFVLYENSYPAPDIVGIDRVDRALLFALIRQESRFKTRARSPAGARGLMQIMPRTAAFIANDRSLAKRKGRNQLLDAQLNIDLGQRYLVLLMGENYFDDNLILTLAAYNAGPGNLRRWRKELAGVDDPLLFIESIPAAETRKYIHNVMANLWIYRTRFNQETPSRRLLAAETWPPHKRQDNVSK